MRKIRIAQIGVNRYSHGGEIFYTLTHLPELFEVVGYTFVEDEKETCQKFFNKFEGYREMTLDEILNDPTIEAVTVETDEIHLTKYAQMAAEHGKHIHMEKPGSQSLADFKKLIDTVKKNGKTFHIGYMYRYNPYISDLIERVKKGELGGIFSVEAHMSRTDNTAVREWLSSFKGGMMFYLGCHLIDIVLQIQGVPKEILPLNTSTGFDGIDSEDYSMAVMKYENGISFVRIAATEVGGYYRRQLVVMGEKGTVEINPLECKPDEAITKYSLYTKKAERLKEADGTTSKKTYESEQFDRYIAMMTAFAAIVRGEKENPYTADYELELFKTILKCCGVEI
ncbi:MAG: Gfo/Idh/MocA family oxidoreductase [Clostridia bacterium]|nr:Gfo/Idh/MocA family oxidoreductase [Clostridia bacterium]